MKKCNCCNEEKDLMFFGKKKSGRYGVKAVCKQCLYIKHKEYMKVKENKERYNEYMRKYLKESEHHSTLNKICRGRRREKVSLMQQDVDKEFIEMLNKDLIDGIDSIDHFIPVSWGCLGNVKNNLITLRKDINMRKSDKNPFTFMETLNDEDRHYFVRKIRKLAKRNNMSYEEFKSFVNWCENNKRSLEDLKKDNTDMLELYKKEMCLIG